jgi:LysR family glycine cleavage system transcriptional activator
MGELNRRAINFNALRAFEAAARHLSMTRAADELRVTHAAVSHQVRQLEERLGVPLFQRTRRGVKLTAAGIALLPVLEDSLDRIAEALEGIVTSGGSKTLTVTTTPSFALQWLVPRLALLRRPNESGFEVHLRPTLRVLDVAHGEVDVTIRSGIPPWPGVKAELLMPVHMTPVCSPKLLANQEHPLAPADLLNFTLLHSDVGNIPIGNEWRTWLHAAGLSKRSSLPGISLQDPALAFQAAIAGAGFAIGYVELLQNEIASGALIRPFDLEVPHIFSYYLGYAQSRENDPGIAEFRQWILGEAKKSLQQSDEMRLSGKRAQLRNPKSLRVAGAARRRPARRAVPKTY